MENRAGFLWLLLLACGAPRADGLIESFDFRMLPSDVSHTIVHKFGFAGRGSVSVSLALDPPGSPPLLVALVPHAQWGAWTALSSSGSASAQLQQLVCAIPSTIVSRAVAGCPLARASCLTAARLQRNAAGGGD